MKTLMMVLKRVVGLGMSDERRVGFRLAQVSGRDYGPVFDVASERRLLWGLGALCAVVLLGLVLSVSPPKASAYSVHIHYMCGHCARETSQLIQKATSIKQLVEDVRSFRTLFHQLKVAERNIKSFNKDFVRDIGNTILSLHRKVRHDGKMGDEMQAAMDEFSDKYPGYERWLEEREGREATQAYRTFQRDSRLAAAEAYAKVGMNRKDLESEGEVLRRLAEAAKTVDGQKEALDLANQIGLAQMKQNQRLQELIATQIDLVTKMQLADQEYQLQETLAKQQKEDEFSFTGALGELSNADKGAFDVNVQGLDGQSQAGRLLRNP